jgi:4-hydroxy-tetrahydrodipicolinate synthase
MVLLASSLGLPGAILAVANVDPEHAIAAFAGDPTAQQALLPAHNRVKASFPFGLKDAIADRFGTSRVTRLG